MFEIFFRDYMRSANSNDHPMTKWNTSKHRWCSLCLFSLKHTHTLEIIFLTRHFSLQVCCTSAGPLRLNHISFILLCCWHSSAFNHELWELHRHLNQWKGCTGVSNVFFFFFLTPISTGSSITSWWSYSYWPAWPQADKDSATMNIYVFIN